MLGVIERQNVRVEGHCVDCLARVMGCLREQGSPQARAPKLKEWWVRIATGASRTGGWESNTAYGGVNQLKATVERWFGGMGLVNAAALRSRENARGGRAAAFGGGGAGSGIDDECRFWYFEGTESVKRDREFVVEFIRIIGRAQKGRKRKRRLRSTASIPVDAIYADEMDIDVDVDVGGSGIHDLHHVEEQDNQNEENEEDDNDEDQEEDANDEDEDDDNNDNTNPNINPNGIFHLVFSEPYTHKPNVIEKERQTKRYDPDRPGDINRIVGLEGISEAYLREGDASNWWRESSKLNRQYGRGKGWVVREEIWIGCSFR